ncbi:ASCH domain-containing protein [Vibrio fluvialis]|nr:ASCH domain-containing protein [Vibrio fluvialis]MBY8132152.1 ASCH domain-containing protein [Vibrio fluvialis]
MKVKPMIFNTEMVKALLDGRKTVTRRPLDQQPSSEKDFPFRCISSTEKKDNGRLFWANENRTTSPTIKEVCNVGDLLYVRETFRLYNNSDECGCSDHCSCPPTGTPLYFATHNNGESKWKPSIHMPRSISRITLKVTDVRIEKLNDLRKSDEQVKKEGFDNWPQFKHVWESIYGQSKPNDYVWVIEFEVIHQGVDKYLSSLSLPE